MAFIDNESDPRTGKSFLKTIPVEKLDRSSDSQSFVHNIYDVLYLPDPRDPREISVQKSSKLETRTKFTKRLPHSVIRVKKLCGATQSFKSSNPDFYQKIFSEKGLDELLFHGSLEKRSNL